MLSQAQESSLTSFGDCFEHWHSSDRALSHDSVLALQAASVPFVVSASSTVTAQQDYVLADTTASAVTITLPHVSAGREIEVTKNAAPNVLIIKPSGSETILGSSEVRVYNYGTSLRFKAVTGGWVII